MRKVQRLQLLNVTVCGIESFFRRTLISHFLFTFYFFLGCPYTFSPSVHTHTCIHLHLHPLAKWKPIKAEVKQEKVESGINGEAAEICEDTGEWARITANNI